MRASDSSRTEIVPRLSMSRMTSFMRLVSPSWMKAPPLTPFCSRKHARHFQTAQRLAQDVAADAELLREVALGRQLVARLENAERQLLADALADFLERAPGVDRAELTGRRRRRRAMIGSPVAPGGRAASRAGGRTGA